MMSEFNAMIGQRIKTLREAQEISQVAFAKQVFMSREMLRRIEQGTVSVAADRLPRLAKELGVSVLDLLAGVDDITMPVLDPDAIQ